MEKKKWPWKRRSSMERSPGESDSSGSFSSQSGRYSDEHDALKESKQPSELASKASIGDDEAKETVKSLTEKLLAALVNVSAKEDLVKQHAKVAEEAVVGWEKAQDEVAALKHQLEVATQQNLNLEARVSLLDGALKECLRQLRQERDEQDQRVSDAVAKKDREWESVKAELKRQIQELEAQPEDARTEISVPKYAPIVEALEKENSFLKQELMSLCKELERVKVERDLSTKAAETASKLQLESVKKVTKLEAECRRLQSVAWKSSPSNNPKSVAISLSCTESLTDSHSDSGDKLNAVDCDARGSQRTSNVDANGSEPSSADSWALALITELDQFKKDKPQPMNLVSSFEIDMMDDFLEMERLAALPQPNSSNAFVVSEPSSKESVSLDNPMKDGMDLLIRHTAELEQKLEKIEAEKSELEAALDESRGSLEAARRRNVDTEAAVEELRNELRAAVETKESLESQIIGMEAEARTVSANTESLNAEIKKERTLSAELRVNCREMENELARKAREVEIQQSMESDSKPKVKQEDLAVAATKLAECQKTIASLGRQLKSLAMLEDFLVDTANIPGLNRVRLASRNAELPKSPCDKVFTDSDTTTASSNKGRRLENGSSIEESVQGSSLTSSANPSKGQNGFGKFFTRSKSVKELT